MTVQATSIALTKDQLAAALAQWRREANEHPEDFDITGDYTPEEFGADSAEYLWAILEDWAA